MPTKTRPCGQACTAPRRGFSHRPPVAAGLTVGKLSVLQQRFPTITVGPLRRVTRPGIRDSPRYQGAGGLAPFQSRAAGSAARGQPGFRVTLPYPTSVSQGI
jgi:hypothetical protein